jgi:hypothetical protein
LSNEKLYNNIGQCGNGRQMDSTKFIIQPKVIKSFDLWRVGYLNFSTPTKPPPLIWIFVRWTFNLLIHENWLFGKSKASVKKVIYFPMENS